MPLPELLNKQTAPIKSRGGVPVTRITYGRATKDQILQIAQEYSFRLHELGKNGRVQVNVMINKGNTEVPAAWRRGSRMVDFGERLEFNQFDEYYGEMEEPDYFPKFQIVVTQGGRAIGGKDVWNDCLYNCLDTVIPEMKSLFPTPARFKDMLGLLRQDLVPLKCIPRVEKLLKDYKINISGDHEYTSTKKSPRVINLILTDEHYELNITNKFKPKNVSHYEKTLMIFRHDPLDNKYVFATCGKQIDRYKYTTIKKMWKVLYKHPEATKYSPFIPVKCKDENMDLLEYWDEYYAIAIQLREKTHGKYNLFKSGTLTNAAKRRFIELNPELDAEPLQINEAKWIEDVSTGPFMWAEKGYEGQVFEYDYTGFYSSILRDKNFFIPIKAGEFKKLSNEEFKSRTFYEYGIYRATIEIPSKLMKENYSDKYTHYCLTRAKELGWKITLIQDENPNFLYYPATSRASGLLVFEKYIDELTILKKQGFATAKELISMIWGVLTEKRIKKILATTKDPYQQTNDVIIESIVQQNDDQFLVETSKRNKQFETPYARLKPFILSRGRQIMSRTLEPNIEYIVRVHTDGFLSSKPLKDFPKSVKLGKNIGELKYEGTKHVNIEHVNKGVGISKTLKQKQRE